MRRARQELHECHAGASVLRAPIGLVIPCFMTLFCVSAASEIWAESAFSAVLELQGFAFSVSATNGGSINQLTIIPQGLTGQQEPVVVEIDGTVSGAEIDDLDGNGFPEVYIYVTSAGSGSYGSLVGYAVNQGQSLSEIYLPPVADNPEQSIGYMGHDAFAVVEGTFVQSFPIYLQTDSNAQPSGKTRQLQYKLAPGEAGWRLDLDKVIEY